MAKAIMRCTKEARNDDGKEETVTPKPTHADGTFVGMCPSCSLVHVDQ